MGLHKYIQLEIDEIEAGPEHDYAVECVKELIRELFDETLEDTSWWEQDEDMKALSLFFPGWTFILVVDQGGVENYKSYYRDGKHCDCWGELVYEKFYKSKMK